MKTKLLLLLCLIASYSFAQDIAAGTTSTFDTGVDGWRHQINNSFEPFQVPNGGPAGAGDGFLRMINDAVDGNPGSKHAFLNDNAEWTGDYTAAGIIAISFDVQNLGSEPLYLRVAMNKSFPNWVASANPTVIAPGTTWTTVTMSINPSDLVVSQGGASIADVLADVDQIRIVSNDGTDPTTSLHKGQGGGVVRQSDYDNITALDVLSVSEAQLQDSFEISPNPATSKLNIKLVNSLNNANIVVYNVLGKKVYSKTLSAMTSSIDVSQWNSGVYLVRLSTDNQTITKRFVKQ